MDSKSIYIASENYLPKVEWVRQDGEDWIYIGVDQDFDEEKVSQLVRSTFETNEAYIVTDRHRSGSSTITEAIRLVKERLREEKHLIWNLTFDPVIEFARMRVVRKGKRA